VSVELLQDSGFDIQSLVSRKLGERIARAQAVHWVTGNGTTEPFGLDTNTTTQTTFTSAGITYAELVTAVHDVDPDYRMGAVWTFSDGTLELIRKLVDTAGRPLLNDADFGINAPPGGATLLGFPVVIDQAWPTYADGVAQTFGAFGNLREGYVIRRVRDIQLIVNPYTRANEGQVEYSVWARADGVPQNKFAYSSLLNAV
jgi:HK97 family phage major capsid protein